MQYKGTFTDIWEALKAFPKGAEDGDFVVISGKVHTWNRRRGMFTTNEAHVPVDHNQPVITLFTELTDGGVLTDHMGNKWQLQPYAERVSIPTIRIEDVTAIDYPSLSGHYNAIFLVSITHEDDECELWYKIVKNGNEPETFTKYNEPIKLKTNGTYQIVAKAKKEGVTDSEVVRSESFKVVRAVVNETYGKPIITEFSYADFAATGDTKLPTFTYSQAGERQYTDGTTEALTPITTDATCNFYGMDGLTPSTGGLTVPRSLVTSRHMVGTVYATVTMNGVVSDTAHADVYQLAAAKTNNRVVWLITPPTPVDSGTTLTVGENILAQAVYDGDVRYYYKEGNNRIYFTTSITITKDVVVGAEVAETTYYKSAYIEVQIYLRGFNYLYIGWGRDLANYLTICNQPGGDGSTDLVNPLTPNYLPTIMQLQSPELDINEQISQIPNQVLWIAYRGISGRPTVTIRQGSDIFNVNEWSTDGLDSTVMPLDPPSEMYNLAYTVIDGSFELKDITFVKTV